MNKRSMLRGVLTALLAVSVVSASSPRVLDVKMNADGVIHGMVVNEAGQGRARVEVGFQSGDQVTKVKSDAQGRFVVRGLKPGLTTATVNGSGQTLRIWQGQVAPPKASTGVMLVNGSVARGQGQTQAFGLTEALITAGAIGGIIAIASGSGS